MDNTSISDISAVANLTNLTGLEVGYHSITDISAVANLTKLTLLGLHVKIPSAIYRQQLQNLTELTGVLRLSLTNPIADYGPLRRLKAVNQYRVKVIQVYTLILQFLQSLVIPHLCLPDGTSTNPLLLRRTTVA